MMTTDDRRPTTDGPRRQRPPNRAKTKNKRNKSL